MPPPAVIEVTQQRTPSQPVRFTILRASRLYWGPGHPEAGGDPKGGAELKKVK